MLKKILEFYFKSYFRFELNLAAIELIEYTYFQESLLPENFVFKLFEVSDIGYLISSGYDEKKIQSSKARLTELNHRKCFAIINTKNDELAYSCWINSLPKYYHNEFESEYVHDGSTVLFETDFTEPAYRRLGLHSYCMKKRILYCKEQGFERAIINIQIRNTPALKTVQKFGFKKTFRIPLALRKGSIAYTFNKLFRQN